MITKFNLFENNTNKSIIDYTYLKKNASIDEIKKICEDADEAGVFGLVLDPDQIGTAKAFLEDSKINVITVIDYPKGDSNTNFKTKELMEAVVNGVDEVDVVFNHKKLKELIILKDEEYTELYETLEDETQELARLSHKNGILIKVIIEIEELSFEQIKIATQICESSGIDFIQTSTGTSKKNPDWNEKLEKIKYMRKILPNHINIKVSGGIRTQEQIDQLTSIGVDRVGTSVFL